MARRRKLRADVVEQVVEAAIAAEEECKSVRISEPHFRTSVSISEPHFIPTHLSTTGSNATRTPEDASCQHPPVLLRLDCSQLIGPRPKPTVRRLDPSSRSPRLTGHPRSLRPAYYSNGAYGDPRSGTGVRSGGTRRSAAALFVHPSRTPRIQSPHVALAPLAAVLVARRYQWRESTMRARQKGDRNPAG